MDRWFETPGYDPIAAAIAGGSPRIVPIQLVEVG